MSEDRPAYDVNAAPPSENLEVLLDYSRRAFYLEVLLDYSRRAFSRLGKEAHREDQLRVARAMHERFVSDVMHDLPKALHAVAAIRFNPDDLQYPERSGETVLLEIESLKTPVSVVYVCKSFDWERDYCQVGDARFHSLIMALGYAQALNLPGENNEPRPQPAAGSTDV